MKRAVLTAVFLAALAALGGCPIYNHEDDGCWRDRDCAPGYLCDDRNGVCYVPDPGAGGCVRPTDCGANETCAENGRCLSGDCTFNGCVSGFRCDSRTGIWQCVSSSSSGGAGGGGGGSALGGGAGELEAAGAAGMSAEMPTAGAGGDATLSNAGAAGG